MAADPRIMGVPGRRAYINAQLVDASSGIDGRGGVLIDDGRIVAVGNQVTAANAGPQATIVDCAGGCSRANPGTSIVKRSPPPRTPQRRAASPP